MKRALKYLIIGVLSIIAILGGLWFWYAVLSFRDFNYYTKLGFQSSMRELLQIPYARDSYERQALKVGWQDLEPISYEEWMDMECECPDNATGKYDSWLRSATKEDLKSLGKEGQKRIMCLQPKIFLGGKIKNAMPEHCTSIFNCNSLQITVNDYVLKHQKVLRNIMKIAEKPCFYLKEVPDASQDFKLADGIISQSHWIKQVRGELHCDDNERTYSVIYVLDKDGAYSAQIIVPRIDTIGK